MYSFILFMVLYFCIFCDPTVWENAFYSCLLIWKNVHKGIRISEENFGKYDKVDVYPLYAAANILHSR